MELHQLLPLRNPLPIGNMASILLMGNYETPCQGPSKGFLGSSIWDKKLWAREEEGPLHHWALLPEEGWTLAQLSRLRFAGTAKAVRNQRASIRHHK